MGILHAAHDASFRGIGVSPMSSTVIPTFSHSGASTPRYGYAVHLTSQRRQPSQALPHSGVGKTPAPRPDQSECPNVA